MLYLPKFSMQTYRSSAVGFVGAFGGSEYSEVVAIPMQFYTRDPKTTAFYVGHSFVTRGIIFLFASISMVFGWSRFAKIFPDVVGFYFITMIDFVLRPFAGHPKPDNSMSHILPTAHSYFYATLVIKESCTFSRDSSFGKCLFPSHYPSFFVVIESFSYKFVREIGQRFFGPSIHSATLKLPSGIVK